MSHGIRTSGRNDEKMSSVTHQWVIGRGYELPWSLRDEKQSGELASLQSGTGPVVPLERHVHSHPSGMASSRKRKPEEVQFRIGWGHVPTCPYLHVHKELGLFLSVFVSDVKMVGQFQNPQTHVGQKAGN